MKREYRKPTIEVVDIETMATCLQAVSWNVRDEKGEIYDPSTDHGYIEEDKYENGGYKPGEYDPWNSDNW